MSVKAIYLSQQDVGKNVKSSKRKFIWKFSIDDKEHTVELYVSSLSGKKKVVHNGRTLTEISNLIGGFNYPFSIGNNLLTVQSVNDSFDLRINSLQFSHLYHTERTKKEFEFEGGYKEAQNNNYNEEYVAPKRNVNKTQKPLYKESEEGYDLGIADGFEQMAPKEYERSSDFQSVSHPQARLNLKINNQKESGRDGFDGFNNKFSKPTQQPAQQQAQVSFAGFGDFGKQTDFQKQPQVDNVFGNFGFNFEQPTQQPKTNPFGPTSEAKQPAPQVAPVVQQPPPVIQQAPPKPAVQSTNLIDFLEDLPDNNVQVQQQPQHHVQQPQPQQQQQQATHKAPITKDLLDDLFGDEPAQQQPAPQPIVTPVTQQQPTLSQGNPLAALYNQSNVQAPQQQSTVQSASVNILNAYNQPQIQQPQVQQQQQYQQPQRQSIQQAYAPYQTYQQPQQQQQYQQPQYQQPQQYQQQPQYVPQYQPPQQTYQPPPQYQQPQQPQAQKPASTPFDDLF